TVGGSTSGALINASTKSRAGSRRHCSSSASRTPPIRLTSVANAATSNDSQIGAHDIASLGNPHHEHRAEIAALLDVDRAAVRLDRELAEVQTEAAVRTRRRTP